MILEIEGKRVQVDDSFAKLSPEEKERQVQEIAQSLFPKQEEKAAPKEEKTVAETLNEAVYPVGGAVAGAGLEAKRGLGRFAQNLARASNPELMAEAKLKSDLNAVEKYGRTQHRVPGMPMEKPGLYFGQPTYELESKRAREEIAKMLADPEYQQKVLAEQKPHIAQYQKRVSPTMAQRAGNFLGRTPLGVLGGAAVGAGAGMQAADAVNRYNKGDMLGATLGGLGTLGTGIAMIPHPYTRVGGTALSLGAEMLNGYIDILKKNNPLDRFLQNNPLAPVGEFQNKQQEQQFMQQNPPAPPPPQNRAQPMPVRMKEGGSVKGYVDGGLVEPMAMSVASPMMASFDPLTTQTTDMPMLKSAQVDTMMPMLQGTQFDSAPMMLESMPMMTTTSTPMPMMTTTSTPMPLAGGVPPTMLRYGMNPVQARLPMLGRTAMRARPMTNLSPVGTAPMAPRAFGPRPAVAPIERSMRAQSPLNMMARPRALKPRTQRPMTFAKGGSTTPAWQRSEGKSPSGGLNAVGRASYKRETGGELKPPQPEGGSRKKSFCARMGGMKKKLTSSKTANDPDSRINKALRKWKC